MATAADNILLAFYTLLWVISFIWYHYKNRHIDGGSAVMASYIVYCFFSFITLNDEFFDITYEHLRLFPFIYLYVMLMLALSPAIKLHRSHVIEIDDPHSKALLIPCFVVILCIFAQIPSVLSNFNSGFVSLLTDSDAGKEAYLVAFENSESAGSAIRNLPAVLYNTLFDCSVFIFFFLLTRKDKNIIFLIFLFLAIIIGMIIPVMDGQRGSVIKCGLTIIAGYMLFRKFMTFLFRPQQKQSRHHRQKACAEHDRPPRHTAHEHESCADRRARHTDGPERMRKIHVLACIFLVKLLDKRRRHRLDVAFTATRAENRREQKPVTIRQ